MTELDDATLCRMFLSRMAAERIDLPAGNQEIVRAYRIVFGRKATADDLARSVGQTVRSLIAEMVGSDEFGCVADAPLPRSRPRFKPTQPASMLGSSPPGM